MSVKVYCEGHLMNIRFVATSDGRNRLGMKELCQEFVNELQMPTCLTKDEAAHYVLDLFKRSVASELELLDVKCVEVEMESAAEGARKQPPAEPKRRAR